MTKLEVSEACQKLVEEWKPKYIKPPPEDYKFNYIVDIFTRTYRNYFYLVSIYACPGPNAISPFFESPFARLEYIGPDCFNVSYMRHTGKWVEVDRGLTLVKALESIRGSGYYHP